MSSGWRGRHLELEIRKSAVPRRLNYAVGTAQYYFQEYSTPVPSARAISRSDLARRFQSSSDHQTSAAKGRGAAD